ncbi:M20/M25/M40 family metallo-hydrolase [Glycomyces rhizosphaerae]|uniref:M20/M25/M40 family metallo-hydrolase n=1 Tax=Glycomyces rhizosphaerae TaxID=2054422 RepID=A0ABV7Q010_9ACTN
MFDEGFTSRVPGVAHLCGHDLHTAIGVGIARALARSSEPIRGRMVFLFQPAEENAQGARAMLDTGLVQKLAPREFYALHCSPFPTGTIVVSPGYGQPRQDHIRIVLPGGDAAAAVAADHADRGRRGRTRRVPGWSFPAMVNSVELSTAAGRYLSAALGPESVAWAQAAWPFNGEDFALCLNEAPGAMFYLGVADAVAGMNGAPHPRFRGR